MSIVDPTTSHQGAADARELVHAPPGLLRALWQSRKIRFGGSLRA